MPLSKEELQRAHSTQVNDNADQLVQNNDGITASGAGLPHPMPVPAPGPMAKIKPYVSKELHEAAQPLKPVLTNAPRATIAIKMGKPIVDISPVFEAMNRGAEANLARHARGLGAGAQVLLHSEDPAQYQKDVELATRQLEGLSEEEYAKRPGWERAANEFATQLLYDPLTYAGGFGLGELLAEKITVLGTENVARAIRMMETSANPKMRLAGAGLAKAYDFAHYKGSVQRALAAKGPEGVAQFRGLKAINNARRTKALDLERSLIGQYHDIIQGLSKDEEGQLYQAVHTGKEAELPENLAMRATAFKNVTDQLAYLSGDEEVRNRLEHGYQEPGYDLFRYQDKPGAPLKHDLKEGTFYAIGKPGANDQYAREDWLTKITGGPGGSIVHSASLSPKNPLHLEGQVGHVGARTLAKLYGAPGKELARWIARTEPGDWEELSPEAQQILRDLGMVNKTGPAFGPVDGTLTDLEKMASHNIPGKDYAMSPGEQLDAIAIRAAKKHGHDAIVETEQPAGSAMFGKTEVPFAPIQTRQFVDINAPERGPVVGGGFHLPDFMSRFDTEKPELYRVQDAEGEPSVSGTRNATFFAFSPEAAAKSGAVVGNKGQQLITRMRAAKRPLMMKDETAGALLPAVMKRIGMRSGLNAQGDLTRAETVKLLPGLLRSLKVPDHEITEMMTSGEQGIVAAEERAATELARKHGYDAIETGDEYIALHPSATTAATGPRGLQNAGQYREHYVPTAHDMKWARDSEDTDSILGRDLSKETGSGTDNEVIDQLHLNQPSKSSGERGDERSLQDILENPKETKPGKVESTLNASDQFLKERQEEARLLKPELQRKIIEQRLKSGARAIAAADAEKEVTRLFGAKTFKGVPADAKQFFEETYNAPGGKEFWTGLAKGAIDVPKVGLFALPFRHSANIGSLLALADPLAVPSALGKYIQLLAVGTGSKRLSKYIPYLDPQLAAARRAAALGKSYKYGVSGVPSLDRQSAAGWVGHIPVLGDIYKASNHMLWTFDDAAKATRFNRLLKKYQGRGMTESQAAYRAADDVGAELIDYSNRSPLTQALAYILPFATYRSKMPGAVLRGGTRHPERIAQAGRLSPELTGDLQQAEPNDQGQPQVGKSYLPLAEVMRGITNPAEYARASLGYPLAFGLSKANEFAMRGAGNTDKDVAFYATYGKDPDLKYLLNATLGSFPGGEAALGAAGLGEFMNQGSLSGAIRGQTGFGVSRGPTPTQLHIPEAIDQAQAAADAARKRGDENTAKKIEQAIGDIKQKYRLFVP